MSQVLFSELGLSESIFRAVEAMEFTEATPVQAQSIPLIRSGADVIAKSQTGTGKTVAFGIPVIEKIDVTEDKPTIQAIILCPTRELAQQAAEEIRKLARFIDGINPVAIYGGAPMDKQCIRLRKANIVIGTPGRIMDHMRRKTIRLNNLKILVLDEADEMLSMGFKEDIETILKDTPSDRQTVLFSATMPPSILALTNQYQNEPQSISIDEGKVTIENIEQRYVDVPKGEKNRALKALFEKNPPQRTIVFCNTKRYVDELCLFLLQNGFSAEGLHGDMRQSQRTAVMFNFKKGKTSVLVATDIAARGIDVNDIDYVINYDIPQNTEYYVHRIGRTGRAGKYGKSITLCCGRKQVIEMKNIAYHVKSDISELKLSLDAPKKELVKRDCLEEMRLALQTKVLPSFKTIVEQLVNDGYSSEDIAAMALQLSFSSENPTVKVKEPKVLSGNIADSAKKDSKSFRKILIRLGKKQRIAPNHLVGAITETTGISSKMIGKIDIEEDHSVIEIPHDLVFEILDSLAGCKICDKPAHAELYVNESAEKSSSPSRSKPKSKDNKKVMKYNDKTASKFSVTKKYKSK